MRVKRIRALNHAAGSGQRATNQRWKAGGWDCSVQSSHATSAGTDAASGSSPAHAATYFARTTALSAFLSSTSPSAALTSWMQWRMGRVAGTHSTSPHSSVMGVTAKRRRYRVRRRLAGSSANTRLSTPAASIMRQSLRRSSLGLARKTYSAPSDPKSAIFLGFCREDITCTRSSMPATVTASG